MNNYWSDVEGFHGIYKINRSGEVVCVSRDRLKYNSLLSVHTTSKGYRAVHLGKNGKSKTFLLHRLLAIAFIPKVEGKNCINHKDGNKSNNNIDNLEWCSVKENNIHAYDKLGKRRAESFTTSKLNNNQVRFIRKTELSSKELAKIFQVCPATICFIRSRKTYASVL